VTGKPEASISYFVSDVFHLNLSEVFLIYFMVGKQWYKAQAYCFYLSELYLYAMCSS